MDAAELYTLTIVAFISLFLGALAGGAIGHSTSFDDGLRANHACRPGVYAESLSGNRVMCVGGNGETWVVRP